MARFNYLLVLLLVSASTLAQSSCGIFARKDDFLSNKVTFHFEDCQMKVQNNKDIVARHADDRLRFKFDFIYGYSDGKNIYRAYGAQSLLSDFAYYKVIYDQEVVVYSRLHRDYRSNLYTSYYYSASKDSRILPLKRKFYSHVKGSKNSLQLNLSMMKESLGLPADEQAYVMIQDDDVIDQKKKPDISARLQTTTRRPKVL